MKRYCITFYNNGKKVCCAHESAKDEVEAEIMAGFALLAYYPNIEFDEVKVSLEE